MGLNQLANISSKLGSVYRKAKKYDERHFGGYGMTGAKNLLKFGKSTVPGLGGAINIGSKSYGLISKVLDNRKKIKKAVQNNEIISEINKLNPKPSALN